MIRTPAIAVLGCLLLWMAGACSFAAASLVCTRLDQGHWQIWLADPDGSNPRRVTATPWDKRSLRPGDAPGTLLLRDNEGRLHRVDLAHGGSDTTMALGFEVIKDFDFNPRLGFLIASYAPNALDNVCVWHLPREGGSRRLLIADPYLNELPRWLASGDRFLFAKSHAGKSRLCLSALAPPKAEDFLSAAVSSASEPCPSPNGTQVLFCAQGSASMDLWICSGSGAQARQLYAGPGLETEPCWSPAGDWAYFTTWDGKNFRVARIQPNGDAFGFVSPASVDSRCPVVIDLGT
jgi:Tol biopolymer transport system component